MWITTGAQTRLKSWGEPRFGTQHRGACAPRRAKGRAGCWVREGVAPSHCEGPGVSTPEIFLKKSDAKFCILVTTCYEWNFLLFENYGQKVGGTDTLLVPHPKNWRTSLPRSLRLLCLWITSVTDRRTDWRTDALMARQCCASLNGAAKNTNIIHILPPLVTLIQNSTRDIFLVISVMCCTVVWWQIWNWGNARKSSSPPLPTLALPFRFSSPPVP